MIGHKKSNHTDSRGLCVKLLGLEWSRMSGLSQKTCIPCRGGIPPLTEIEIQPLLKELEPGWKVLEGHHLENSYEFSDFKQALGFTNLVGGIAETQGHHPDIALAWGRVQLKVWTHKIDGLTESDFILAAKIDVLSKESEAKRPS